MFTMESREQSKMDSFKDASVTMIIYILCSVRRYWYWFLLGVIIVVANIVGLVIWHHYNVNTTITLTAIFACFYAIILIISLCSCKHFSKTYVYDEHKNNDFMGEESGLIHVTEKLTNWFYLNIIAVIVSTIGLITLGVTLIVWLFTE